MRGREGRKGLVKKGKEIRITEERERLKKESRRGGIMSREVE